MSQDILRPEGHSALGGSGASRWMKCPGSVRLSQGVEDPESEYASEGTLAHWVLEQCLKKERDAWEYINESITKEMVDAVQVAVDAIRDLFPGRNQSNSWVELQFYAKELHRLMFGQIDWAFWHEGQRILHILDYKHGAGIEVEVQGNPQLMYYAVGVIDALLVKPEKIVLWVAQPRAFHFMGPIRSWSISYKDLMRWRDEELIPAMDLAEEVLNNPRITDKELMEKYTESGQHCRFCPARMPWEKWCPRLSQDMKEMGDLMAKVDTKEKLAKAHNETIGDFLSKFELAKIVQKAAREVGFARASSGVEIPGWQLSPGRANRVWKSEAEKILKEKYGDRAYTKPELKSPAQIDPLPEGKALTAELAFKPEAGLQLVPADGSRPDIGPKGKSMFKPIKKN